MTKIYINGVEVDKLSKELVESLAALQKEIEDQRQREQLDPPDRIRIEHPGIVWKPFVQKVWVKGEQFPFVEISWGWSAGLSQDQITRLSADIPQGKESLLVSQEFVDDLIKDLQNIKS